MDDLLVSHYVEPIAKYLADDDVNEVCINRWNDVWIERLGRLEKVDACWESEDHFAECLRQIAHSLEQEIDSARRPVLDARLPNGARVNAVLQPIAVGGAIATIRPFRSKVFTFEDLQSLGTFPSEIAAFFDAAFSSGRNIIIAGETGSGKTAFLRSLSKFFYSGERIVVVEDTNENLAPNHDHVVQFEAANRSSSNRDTVEITMGSLISNALRARPDRIIVGEIRTGEAATAFLQAINTGHSGCVTTIHANDCQETVDRIVDLLGQTASSNVTTERLVRRVTSNTHIIVHVKKYRVDGRARRRVSEIATVSRDGGVEIQCSYQVDEDCWTGPLIEKHGK